MVYSDIEDGEEFDTIEEALLTNCHICGGPLEWSLTVIWDETNDKPAIHGESFSCGIIFKILPTENGYMTVHNKEE